MAQPRPGGVCSGGSRQAPGGRDARRGNRATHLCGDLDYGAIRDVLRGVERTLPQPERLRRFGVRTQDLAKAIRDYVDTSSVEGSMWAAALATRLLCSLCAWAACSADASRNR